MFGEIRISQSPAHKKPAAVSALPRTARFVARHPDVAVGIDMMTIGGEYRGRVDGLVALLGDEFESRIRSYYADRGPCLEEEFGRSWCRRLDARLVAALAQASKEVRVR